jgi:hypothetical protein
MITFVGPGGGPPLGTVGIVVIVVVVLLVVAGVAALVVARQRQHRRQLAEQFGPEYERRVAETGDRKAVEQELKERKERHDQLELRALDPGERDRFQADWLAIQRGFVDDPGGSVEHADALVVTIMRSRGYPVEDGRQRADDLSVAHPDVVEHYREARRIASANRDGQASTEDLRSAVTAFRSLVDALLAGGQDAGGQDAGGGRRDASGGRGPCGDDAPAGGPGGSTQRLDNPEASTQQLGADRGGNDDGGRR